MPAGDGVLLPTLTAPVAVNHIGPKSALFLDPVAVSPILVWNGTAWVPRPLLTFNGTEWVPQ